MNPTKQREKVLRNEFNHEQIEKSLNFRLNKSSAELEDVLKGQYIGNVYDTMIRFLINHIYLKEKKEEFLKRAEIKSNMERDHTFICWSAVNIALIAIFLNSLMMGTDWVNKYLVFAMFSMNLIAVFIKYIFDYKKAIYFDKLCEMTIEDAELFINNEKG